MSKSCSASPAWQRTTPQSGSGSSATVPNSRSGSTVISSQPISPGVSMRLRSCQGPLGLPLPSHRFHRSHDLLRALGLARCRCGQTSVPQGADCSVASSAPRHQHRLGTPLRGGDFRGEKGSNSAAPLPPPACPILEQHPGAGSSSDQTTREGQAGLSCIPRGPANDQGYEAMHRIRKGQARRVNGSDVRQQIQFINKLFEVAA